MVRDRTHRDSLPLRGDGQIQSDTELSELLPIDERRKNVSTAIIVHEQLPIVPILLQLLLERIAQTSFSGPATAAAAAIELQIYHAHQRVCAQEQRR